MSPTDLTVIAPCLDEEGNIDELVSRTLRSFDQHRLDGQLVLVDDGSTDATWARIQAWMAADSRVVGVRHPRNHGIVAAWLTGLNASSGQRVCLIDSDLQNRPEDIPRLAAAQVNLNEVAQGVRYPSRGVRRLYYFSRTLNVVLNSAFQTQLRDNKSGFIVCHRTVLAAILAHRFTYKYFQCFVGVSATSLGLRIVEVDTAFDNRRAGHSFLPSFPIGASSRIVWEIFKFRIETWIRRPSERPITLPKSV